MKDFGKIVWGSTIGIIIGGILLSILSFVLIAGIAASASASGNQKVSAPVDAVLDIDMSTLTIAEQTLEPNPFEEMGISTSGIRTEEMRTVGILDATVALEEAANDPEIKMAYIRPDMAMDISHLEEFRNALLKFRESGKPVIAYIETPTNAGFYLASAADRIFLSNYRGGMNMLVGLSGQMIFVKDLLDKLGVNMQLIRHGKYKSAGEMFIRNSASPENLEQNTVMIKGIWNEMAGAIAGRSGMSKEEFNKLIDNLDIVDSEDFLEYKLVDETVNYEGMKDKLAAMMNKTSYDQVNSIAFADYASLKVKTNFRTSDKIAIVYADGEIVDGRDLEQVAGKRFADILKDVEDDDNIKAVILRVNSPGGSVKASEQIRDAVYRIKGKKPVIASYGSYAASGGYWISSCCDYIFSDATTLTGSIGVFGIIPDFSKTMKNIAHVNITAVPTNKHSDMYGAMRPLSDVEKAYVQKDIEEIYTRFTTIVADGRNMDVAKVDELGQGRVWTGTDALENGLVDKIGGLKDALDYTAELVGCQASYRVVNYPKPLTVMEQLMEAFQPVPDNELVKIAGEIAEVAASREAKIFARLPYTLEIR